ncbi:nucleotidyltransferase family protein [Variovorax sp. PCZ-1]|uniref:nucleotidyltransferase family protein n=1 Tax=Variovorax sp. PCZ-1 TaxID=2835533 RepID=UPI001BCE0F87|nr:nucleotidyltransferase family protein [Variovorax sp. PCZ-1]MBS7808874.1 nucleotidyltransferase family protein [Variovorax sp. PCZ-1]
MNQESTLSAQAMILAAGRGERMRPLTDATPKPLLQVRGKPLMQWHMEALLREGFAQQLINTAWLGEQIEAYFLSKNGSSPARILREVLLNQEQTTSPVHLQFSHEGRDFGGALETAGGICRALPHLAEVFWVVAGDVFMPQFEFNRAAYERFENSDALAHLWLVPNPAHNPRGDFGISATGQALNLPKDAGYQLYTFSTVALYKRAFFEPPLCDIPAGNPQGIKTALAPLLRAAMDAGRVSASLYEGEWTDVGTPERLAQLNAKT